MISGVRPWPRRAPYFTCALTFTSSSPPCHGRATLSGRCAVAGGRCVDAESTAVTATWFSWSCWSCWRSQNTYFYRMSLFPNLMKWNRFKRGYSWRNKNNVLLSKESCCLLERKMFPGNQRDYSGKSSLTRDGTVHPVIILQITCTMMHSAVFSDHCLRIVLWIKVPTYNEHVF